jgi:Trefoil (P-type) domain
MKKLLMFVIPGLIGWMGCTAEVDGTPVPADPLSEGADIDQATAAFNSCVVLGRRDIPNGFVETLRCDGVGCMRTCFISNIGGAMACSMKCENGPEPPRMDPILDLSILRAECQIQPAGRINAGWPGISKNTCEGERGACFDNRTSDPKFPWCYEPMGKVPTCGGISPAARINAGFPGISGQECVRSRGACFDNTIPNVPWCFQVPPQ